MSKASSILFGLVVMLALGAGGFIYFTERKDAPHKFTPDRWTRCKASASNALKSPRSAVFPEYSEVSKYPLPLEDESSVEDLPVEEYGEPSEWLQVRAWVDAQNSYGALIRSDVLCLWSPHQPARVIAVFPD